MLREYVWLDGEPFLLAEYTGTSAGMYFYLNDHLGTPQQLLNGETGAVAWQAAYLPFGEAQVQVSTVTNNIRFPGQYYDAETGLHYNWNRYYDPESGRYISADPIELEGGVNFYIYTHCNPINIKDFEGLKECIDICSLNKGKFHRNIIDHKINKGPPSSLTWYEECPVQYPNFDSAHLISTGAPPKYPKEHPFPWESREIRNGLQIFNVPSRSSFWFFSGLGRVRIEYRCCRE